MDTDLVNFADRPPPRAMFADEVVDNEGKSVSNLKSNFKNITYSVFPLKCIIPAGTTNKTSRTEEAEPIWGILSSPSYTTTIDILHMHV